MSERSTTDILFSHNYLIDLRVDFIYLGMVTNGVSNGNTTHHWRSRYPENDELDQFYIPEKNRRNAELDLMAYVKKRHNIQFGE